MFRNSDGSKSVIGGLHKLFTEIDKKNPIIVTSIPLKLKVFQLCQLYQQGYC